MKYESAQVDERVEVNKGQVRHATPLVAGVGRGPIGVQGRHARQRTGKGQVEQLSLLIPSVALVAIGLLVATGTATEVSRVTGEL